MKRCFRCQRLLSIEEFYTHPQMRDGHLNKCKDCARADSAKRLKLLARDPQWLAAERRRKVAYALRHKPIYRQQWPEKARAHNAINYAVQAGTIQKPARCQRCGRSRPRRLLHAHHADYGRPLDVVWVCAHCHAVIEGRAR